MFERNRFIAALTMVLMLLSVSVYAEKPTDKGAGPGGTPPSAPRGPSGADGQQGGTGGDRVQKSFIKDLPGFDLVEAQYAILKDLRDTQQPVVEQLRIVISENMDLNAQFLSQGTVEGTGNSEFQKQIIALRKQINEINTLMNRKKSLQNQAKALQPDKLTSYDKEHMQVVVAKMETLTAEIDAVAAQIAVKEETLRQEMTSAMEAFKVISENGGKNVPAPSETLTEYRRQTTVIKEEIKALLEKENAVWAAFKEAVETQNIDGALKALTQKNQFRQEIVEKLKAILALESKITLELKRMLSTASE